MGWVLFLGLAFMALGLSWRLPSGATYAAMTLVIVATLTYEFTKLHG